MNKTIELLAPAGNKESFIGAINAGANAIYLAGKSFGARKYASNFDNDELVELIKYAHKRYVKVFVTVNTIIYENELEELFEYSDFLVKANVDALIVQDIGVIHEFVQRYPETEIHASTQMNSYNLNQVSYLKDIGVKRVILSRETSKDTIKSIKDNLDIELEAFIHGALCVSYSGNCFFSSFNGGRSGNRGECAQPCRLKYDLSRNKEVIEKNSYVMSTKDLLTLNHIEDLINSGINSFKIEGRMKKPEYVIATVRAYREAIDSILDNKEFDYNKRLHELLASFNREYTKGYINNELPSSINNSYRPNHLGIEVGKVVAFKNGKATIKLTNTLSKRDGFRILGKKDIGGEIGRILKNGNPIETAYKGDIIEIDLRETPELGSKIHMTSDYNLNKSLQPYLEENYKLIPLTIKVDCFVGNKISITLKTIHHEINHLSEYVVEEAKTNPQKRDQIGSQINKFGNTFYDVTNVIVNTDSQGFIPNSVLKKLRREAVEKLNKVTLKRETEISNTTTPTTYKKAEPKIKVKVETREQFDIVKELGIKDIYIGENVILSEDEITNPRYYLYLNRIWDSTNKYKNYPNLVVHDFGAIKAFKDKNLVTSEYFNVVNSLSLKTLSNVAHSVTLSYENEFTNIKNIISTKSNLPLEVIVYGKPDLMISKYCPITKSEGVFKENCNLCMKNDYDLIDKFDNKFPIIRDYKCNIRILHSKPLWNDKILDYLKKKNVSIRVDFTNEHPNKVRKILSSILDKY